VPEKYLACFAIDNGLPNQHGFFHEYNLDSKRYQRVHVNNVCHIKNFYDILDGTMLKRFNETDPRFIENNFKYEKHIQKVLNAFRSRPPSIVRDDLNLICRAYVSMKHRNPYFRKLYANNKPLLSAIADKLALRNKSVVEQVVKEWSQKRNIDSSAINVDSIFKGVKHSMLNDPLQSTDTHLVNLLAASKGENSAEMNAIIGLTSCEIFIFEAQNNDLLICSDNPGFTFFKNETYNTNFGQFDHVMFPINSKQLLMFTKPDVFGLGQINKSVYYYTMPPDALDIINQSTIKFSNGLVFCKDREYLKQVINKSSRKCERSLNSKLW
jgi:hypothetical protein